MEKTYKLNVKLKAEDHEKLERLVRNNKKYDNISQVIRGFIREMPQEDPPELAKVIADFRILFEQVPDDEKEQTATKLLDAIRNHRKGQGT